MRILISNDDGVRAEGLNHLYNELSKQAECMVIAPALDNSGVSSALTLDRPLYPEVLDNNFISLNGTPVDCVHLGINSLFEEPIDLMISGINHGANLGDDVIHSGTVAAALEARYLKHAYAVSLASKDTTYLATAVKVACLLVSGSRTLNMPLGGILNINIPPVEYSKLNGFRVTRLGRRKKAPIPIEIVNPRGKKGYWIAGVGMPEDEQPGTDFHAITNNFVSITPLRLDKTSSECLDLVQCWIDTLEL